MCSPGEHINAEKGKKGFQPESGSVRDIANWLDKGTGDVVSIGKLSSYLKIYDKIYITSIIQRIKSNIIKKISHTFIFGIPRQT